MQPDSNSVFGGGFNQEPRSHQADDFSGFNNHEQDAEIEVHNLVLTVPVFTFVVLHGLPFFL